MNGFKNPITPVANQRISDLCNGTQATVGDLDATTQQLLRSMYHRDFELFDYDPLPQKEAPRDPRDDSSAEYSDVVNG